MSASTQVEDLRTKIAFMEQQLRSVQRPLSAGDAEAMEQTQRRADALLTQHGLRAPTPRAGESPEVFRHRTMVVVAEHSPKFKTAQLYGVTGNALEAMEQAIYADAQSAIHRSANDKPGVLVPVQERDHAGRLVTRFVGDPMCWMQTFMSDGASGHFVDPGKAARFR